MGRAAGIVGIAIGVSDTGRHHRSGRQFAIEPDPDRPAVFGGADNIVVVTRRAQVDHARRTGGKAEICAELDVGTVIIGRRRGCRVDVFHAVACCLKPKPDGGVDAGLVIEGKVAGLPIPGTLEVGQVTGRSDDIVLVAEIPERARLPGHEGHGLREVQPRAAAEGHDAVIPALAVDLQPGLDIRLVRVRIDLGKDRAAHARAVQHVERLRGDVHRRQPLVGDQERFLDPRRNAGLGHFRDAARAEADRGGVGPVAGQSHGGQPFFRW